MGPLKNVCLRHFMLTVRKFILTSSHSTGRFAKPFQFVQLSVLREYLAIEFGKHVDYASVGGFDLERVVRKAYICKLEKTLMVVHRPIPPNP